MCITSIIVFRWCHCWEQSKCQKPSSTYPKTPQKCEVGFCTPFLSKWRSTHYSQMNSFVPRPQPRFVSAPKTESNRRNPPIPSYTLLLVNPTCVWYFHTRDSYKGRLTCYLFVAMRHFWAILMVFDRWDTWSWNDNNDVKYRSERHEEDKGRCETVIFTDIINFWFGWRYVRVRVWYRASWRHATRSLSRRPL